jgi:hypothetical protein
VHSGQVARGRHAEKCFWFADVASWLRGKWVGRLGYVAGLVDSREGAAESPLSGLLARRAMKNRYGKEDVNGKGGNVTLCAELGCMCFGSGFGPGWSGSCVMPSGCAEGRLVLGECFGLLF